MNEQFRNIEIALGVDENGMTTASYILSWS